ncbi:MAG: DUF2586 family protein [Nitrosomonadaceae bacterium]
MATNDVTFVRGQGGLGRPLASQDHVSGMLTWLTNTTLPTGFATAWVTATAYAVGDVVEESGSLYRALTAHTSGVFATDLAADEWVLDNSATVRVKTLFSIEEAEALGITEGSATTGIIWYHINEYFRVQPQGELWLGIYDSAAISYASIESIQNFSAGKIRQMGVLDLGTTFSAANTTTLQASVTALQAVHMPMNVVYAADVSSVSDLSTLADLRALSNDNVSVIIGEDGNAAGAALALSSGASVTALGATLGAIALAKVSDNIGWVLKFNMVTGTEFDVPAMANGQKVKDLSAGLLTALNDKGYIFLKKFVGDSGTYFNDSHTATPITGDFAYVENGRTIDKAIRGIRTFMLPNLNGAILVNPDGTLSETTIALFENDASRALDQMERDEEVSAFQVTINPTQDVLATSEVVVTVVIVPVGVARQIKVNIGFAVSIS